MLEKRYTNSGRVYTNIGNLKVWDKNPRKLRNPDDIERLKRQIALLGQYKPNIVTEDGLTVGGNMRLVSMQFLNSNVLVWFDEDEKRHEIDRRGQFSEVWITELSFGKVAHPQEYFDNGGTQKYKAIIDGTPEEREYDSVEQIMIEYAISDNDPIGENDSQLMRQLISPHMQLMPQNTYMLEVASPVRLETFIKSDEETKKEAEKKKGDKNYKGLFQVVVDCKSEADQEEAYNKLQELGFTCKVLTL